MRTATPKLIRKKKMFGTNAPILLVEDNENDILFMTLALQEAEIPNPLHVARNGREALSYLEGTGKFADRDSYPQPYLVLLDLKLPYIMGLDVLKWVRERREFDPTVVIVLTSSANPEDVDEAYRLRANAYLVKPSGIEKLNRLVLCLKEFWLTQNQPASVFAVDYLKS